MPEFRRDPVSGEWVLFAPRRAAWQSHDFRPAHLRRPRAPVRACPFERVPVSHEVIARYGSEKEWTLAVVKNQFPAVAEAKDCPVPRRTGFVERMPGTGHHYLLVTRDHDRGFADLSLGGATGVLRAFQDTYRLLAKDPCIAYVSMFQNWGPSAGASVYHPHYQVIALPVTPLHVAHSVDRSALHGRRTHSCIHCELVRQEQRARKRVVVSTPGAVAVMPFAPRKPFEVRVFPTRHVASFDEMTERDLRGVAAALQVVLRRIRRVLRDPDYNFFIHTAPLTARPGNRWYHWHIEVVPHLTKLGGFELATHFEINPVLPEVAARALRGRD